MLVIECPFCGKEERREFRDDRSIHHSIVCDECKLIERGRITLANMATAITLILAADRPMTREKIKAVYALHRLREYLTKAIQEIDDYIDEVPF